MACALNNYGRAVGAATFIQIYLIPYLVSRMFHMLSDLSDTSFEQLANHWIVMLTFLHHSDPTIRASLLHSHFYHAV
jgi:hypothetical protein